jgi:hypothetical protein
MSPYLPSALLRCGSVRLKRPMRRMCGSVRLMRHKGQIGRCFCRFCGFGALRTAEGDGLPEKTLEGPFSSGGMPIIGTLIHDFDRQSVTWLAAIQQAGIFVFHLISPMTNGTISSSSAAGWRRSRLSFGDRVIWARGSDRSSGVFQVVKTAQSRGRTERTLLVL